MNAADLFTDVLVIGSGIAGLFFALKIADYASVLIVTKKEKAQSNTNYAQGGIATVLSSVDSFKDHISDTLKCGNGLSKKDIVEKVVRSGPALVQELAKLGVNFSRSTTTFARLR